MCGILGVWNQQKVIDTSQFLAALNTLNHRGPNQESHWLNTKKSVALGHKRLSIIGIENGLQPISNEDKTCHIVVNGAFYAYEKIRFNLQKKGHIFKTESDSEIAIHLYEEYGLDFIHHLKGEFSLLLFDEKKQKMIAARDRFGIKPLCYYHQNNQWIFASEAKAILKMGVSPTWNENALSMMMNMQYLPSNESVFDKIQQVKPAHLLEITSTNVREINYWDLDYSKRINVSEKEAVENIQYLLENAVKERLNTKLPVACHLSGGIDSAINLAYTSKLANYQVDCFTASFPNQVHDESHIAKEIADYLGAKHHIVEISPLQLMEEMENAVYFSESLAINGHLAAKYILNKKIHQQNYKIVLGGEGADELFFGYPHLKQDLFLHQNNSTLLKQLLDTNSISNGVMISPHQDKNIPSFVHAKAENGKALSFLCTEEWQNKWKEISFLRTFETHFLNGKEIQSVEKSAYLWTKSALVNYILKAIGDGTEMANSLEGRLPFLDYHLVDYVQKLPLDFKIKEGVEKYILRESVKNMIPESVRTRQKQAFISPSIPLKNQKTKEKVMDILHSQLFSSIPFLDTQKIIQWMEKNPQTNQSDTVLNMLLSIYFVQKNLMI